MKRLFRLALPLAAVVLLLVVVVGFTGLGLPPLPFDEAAWRGKVESCRPRLLHAPHRDGEGRFFNPWLPQKRGLWRLLRWRLSRNGLDTGGLVPPPAPRVDNPGTYLKDPRAPDSLTWVGHATYVIQWSGQVVVTDPFFGQRALVVKRLVPPAFGPGAIPAGAVVIISHNHYDHLDADSVAALAPRATFLCPLGLGPLLRGMGARRVRELDWWQTLELGGSRFTFLPLQHWSRRLGQSYNRSLWGGWLLERGGRKIFYGGDSGYFVGFKEFGRRFPGIDLALLPVGAYQPRWFMHYAHMNVKESLRAFRDLGAKVMVPTQWGVLKLGDEPASWPVVELRRLLARRPGLRGRVKILPVGGRLMLP